jgi:hypothetical protein
LEAGIGLRLIGHWDRCLSAYSTAMGGQGSPQGSRGCDRARNSLALCYVFRSYFSVFALIAKELSQRFGFVGA